MPAQIKNILKNLPYLKSLLAGQNSLKENNETLRSQLSQIDAKLRLCEKELGEYKALPDVPELKTNLDNCLADLDEYKTWMPPGHFYSPIPDVASLKLRETEVFRVPRGVRGIDAREQSQLELLDEFKRYYGEQPFTAERQSGRRYQFENPNYSYADAVFLYCMIRRVRPSRIVEIGSGYSSCAMLDINQYGFDNSISCTFIDPYPDLLYDLVLKEDLNKIEVIDEAVQDVDIKTFLELSENDVLFVDSSHVTKTGSDVNYILFEVLPLLKPGVYVHFHDVFHPFEYPREWVYEGRAWNESYMLRAFLMYNAAFQIELFTTYLIEYHRDFFAENMPLCVKSPSGSIWLKKLSSNPALERSDDVVRNETSLSARLDLTDVALRKQIGSGWYKVEGDHRWMAKRARVRLGGPVETGASLWINAYNPHEQNFLLKVHVNGIDVGISNINHGDVHLCFTLPPALLGKDTIVVALDLDHGLRLPNDERELGLSFGSIEIR